MKRHGFVSCNARVAESPGKHVLAGEHPSVWSDVTLIAVMLITMMLGGCGRADRMSVATVGSYSEYARADYLAGDRYDAVQENQFVNALDCPQSTFAVDVDTASYANIRRMLREGQLPPKGAVRIEELVNYFSYDYPEPDGEQPFSITTELAQCPWNSQHQLLRIGLKGRSVELQGRKPTNLVFLLDVSGSMTAADRLPLVQASLRMLLSELDERDRVAIVAYAGATGVVLDSTTADHQEVIEEAFVNLQAGGSTHGSSGILAAYEIAERNFITAGTNRVILCTDGDFNVGVTNESDLVDLIQQKAEGGVHLTVLGFGRGNLNDSMMEKLADRGNGNYGYIDSLLEARRLLVEQIGGTLMTIAKDVKVQVDFNPLFVDSYRLVGYENRLLANRDFRDDRKDAGEIGAGHCVTALYELVPPTAVSEPLGILQPRQSEFVKHQVIADTDGIQRTCRLTVNLRYKPPQDDVSRELQVRLPASGSLEVASSDLQFASAVATYGMLLRDSEFVKTDWQEAVRLAEQSVGQDTGGRRSEFVQLAKLAQSLVDR